MASIVSSSDLTGFVNLPYLSFHYLHCIRVLLSSNLCIMIVLVSPCRSNGRLARLECTSFFFPLSVRKTNESGEDYTFKYVDAPNHVSDRSNRGAGSDDDEDDGKNE